MDQTREGEFVQDVDGLDTVEDFLHFFEVDYDASLIQRKRVPFLRLFQQILSRNGGTQSYGSYKQALCIAYKQLEFGRELAFTGKGCEGCSSCDE
jgi:hypothetical protein